MFFNILNKRLLIMSAINFFNKLLQISISSYISKIYTTTIRTIIQFIIGVPCIAFWLIFLAWSPNTNNLNMLNRLFCVQGIVTLFITFVVLKFSFYIITLDKDE